MSGRALRSRKARPTGRNVPSGLASSATAGWAEAFGSLPSRTARAASRLATVVRTRSPLSSMKASEVGLVAEGGDVPAPLLGRPCGPPSRPGPQRLISPATSGPAPPRTTRVNRGGSGGRPLTARANPRRAANSSDWTTWSPSAASGRLALHRQVEPLGGEVLDQGAEGRLVEGLVGGRALPVPGVGVEAVELDVDDQVLAGDAGGQRSGLLGRGSGRPGSGRGPGRGRGRSPGRAARSAGR